MPLVSGRVTTPSGQPAAGVYVYAHSAELRGRPDCHTDTTGTWRLELPAGTWTVRPVGHAAVTVDVGDDEPVEVGALGAGGADPGGSSLPGRGALAAALARRRDGRGAT